MGEVSHLESAPWGLRKVLWAVDPLAAEMKLQSSAAQLIGALAQRVQPFVEPVSVISPRVSRFTPMTLVQENIGEFCMMTERHLSTRLDRTRLPSLAPLRMLIDPEPSLRSSVRMLLEYAKESRSDLITVATHARHGFERLRAGSFAESLIACSPIPVVVVNPKTHPIHSLDTIVFATDFSPRCEEALRRLLPLAHDLGCRLVVYHHGEKATDSIEQARQWGVEAELVVERGRGAAAQSILHYARTRELGTCLIAVAPHLETIASHFRRSVTRELMRQSVFPVWVAPCPGAAVVADCVNLSRP